MPVLVSSMAILMEIWIASVETSSMSRNWSQKKPVSLLQNGRKEPVPNDAITIHLSEEAIGEGGNMLQFPCKDCVCLTWSELVGGDFVLQEEDSQSYILHSGQSLWIEHSNLMQKP